MRYGIIAQNPAEERLMAEPAAPRALLDTFLPVVQAQAIMTAVKLRVFEALRAGPSTSAALAERLALDIEALELLLRVVVCAGYVARTGGAYTLTETARQTLLPDSPGHVTAYVGLNAMSWEWIAQLDEVVRSGRGLNQHQHLMGDTAAWATYQRAMLETARFLAPMVAALVPIRPGARRLLDVAGSHGLYAALLCRAHPPLRAEVLDLPQAVRESRALAQAEGIDDVVTHREGDALLDDLGSDYDAIFLGNILHHFTPEQCRNLTRRARRALAPGGTVAVWEIRRPAADEPPELFGDAFALFFRVTSTARCYAEAEYTGWLCDAGFVDVTVQPTPLAPAQLLLTGRAP
jgi:SAM-dependent methyltransferase